MIRALLLLGVIATAGTATAAPGVTLLSSVDGAPPTAAWKYLRLGQQVRVIARITPHRAQTQVRWFRLDPVPTSLDNTQPAFHFEPIRYARVELTACRDRLECDGAEALSVLGGSPVAGTGTVALAVEARLPDGTSIKSADESKPVLGGVGPSVHRITVRRDDSYLGHLTELFNTPYIFGSSGSGALHQTDLLLGSDCADLAVYGMRRLGAKVPYVSTWTIDQHAKEIRVAHESREGTAVDARGAAVRIGGEGILPGDLLLFPRTRHVGVLYEDRAPLGVLDDGDLLLHTCWARPTIEPLSMTSCASYPMRVLRPPLPAPRASR